MKKLRLHIDDLRVDSFETDATRGERGTVHAHVSCRCTNAQGATCGGGASCNGGQTCDTDCSGITYVDSCPCNPGDSYNCATADASCNSPSCVYSCAC
ncbi:MAG TPA: hypothetical protein VFT45_19895 [Longimicrobium sp.]|nr:hypothetical protein [Longimicrobium sp.]